MSRPRITLEYSRATDGRGGGPLHVCKDGAAICRPSMAMSRARHAIDPIEVAGTLRSSQVCWSFACQKGIRDIEESAAIRLMADE